MNPVASEIRQLVETWMDAKASRNLSLLSRQSGIPYPTIRRVFSGENEPSLDTVLAFLSVVADSDQSSKLLESHFPIAATFVSRMQLQPMSARSRSDIDEEVRDRVSFAVLAMAGAEGGTSERDVAQKFGEYGTVKLRRLLELGAIKEADGRYFREVHMDDVDMRLKLDQIRHAVDLFQMEQIGDPAVFAQLHTDGLSSFGIKLLAGSLEKFLDDVGVIARRNPGPNVMMFGLVSGFIGKASSE